jgi:hypothetical protein
LNLQRISAENNVIQNILFEQIAKLKEELRETTQTYEELKEQTEHLEFLVLETQENKVSSTLSCCAV